MEAISLKLKPNIFEYNDYRVYLRDLFLFCKETKPFFSYRYFSKRAGLTSPNFLKLVIDGKRNLSDASAEKFCIAFHLTQAETDFFRNLVRFCQSKSNSEKSISARAILKSRAFKNIHPLKQIEMNYYAKWYYIPLRELVGTKNFKEDSEWIAGQFRTPITVLEIKKALNDLEGLGLIKRNQDGRLQQTHKNIETQNDIVSSLISQYHKDMILKGKNSIDEIHHTEREISGTCISCSAETVLKIKNLMREFRKEILAVADECNSPDMVYQMNFQLFPLVGKKAGRESV